MIVQNLSFFMLDLLVSTKTLQTDKTKTWILLRITNGMNHSDNLQYFQQCTTTRNLLNLRNQKDWEVPTKKDDSEKSFTVARKTAQVIF